MTSTTAEGPRTAQSFVCSPGRGGFFFDDQAAIKAGTAARDGFTYVGHPHTPDYTAIREPAEVASLMLILDDGHISTGDCASVQYSGVGGREPRLHAANLCSGLEALADDILDCIDTSSFRSSAQALAELVEKQTELGAAASYGLTQVALDAVAHATGRTMARVVIDEWGLDAGPLAPVPLYAQTGEDRMHGVDKMILKKVDVIPHGLINHPDLIGKDANTLRDYIAWVVQRVAALRTDGSYVPPIHIDVYGLLGAASGMDIQVLADMIGRLEAAAHPHSLRLEHPLDAGGRDAQIAGLFDLRGELQRRGSSVLLVADEWANSLDDIRAFAEAHAADLIQVKTPDLGSLADTIEAVLACQAAGIGAIVGGTCTESDVSARASVHIALATRAAQLLAKPGMGVDEGLMIVGNEMQRAQRLDELLQAGASPR